MSGEHTAWWDTLPRKTQLPEATLMMAACCRHWLSAAEATSISTSPSCSLTAPLPNTSSLPSCKPREQAVSPIESSIQPNGLTAIDLRFNALTCIRIPLLRYPWADNL